MFSNWLIYSPCFSIASLILFNVYDNGVLIFPPGTLFTWPARRLLLVILKYIQLLIFLLVSDKLKKDLTFKFRIPPSNNHQTTQRTITHLLTTFVGAVSPSTDIMTPQRQVWCWHLQRCWEVSIPVSLHQSVDPPTIQLIKQFNPIAIKSIHLHRHPPYSKLVLTSNVTSRGY